MKDLWKVIRHNYALIGSTVFVCIALLWIYGCESNVMSLKYPGQQVNRAELMLELQTITSEAELRIKDLDKQDQFKEALFNIAVMSAEAGTLNPISVALTLASFLGIGAVVDNRRKDVIIKTLKKNSS